MTLVFTSDCDKEIFDVCVALLHRKQIEASRGGHHVHGIHYVPLAVGAWNQWWVKGLVETTQGGRPVFVYDLLPFAGYQLEKHTQLDVEVQDSVYHQLREPCRFCECWMRILWDKLGEVRGTYDAFLPIGAFVIGLAMNKVHLD